MVLPKLASWGFSCATDVALQGMTYRPQIWVLRQLYSCRLPGQLVFFFLMSPIHILVHRGVDRPSFVCCPQIKNLCPLPSAWFFCSSFHMCCAQFVAWRSGG
jgi:hypothetical protein